MEGDSDSSAYPSLRRTFGGRSQGYLALRLLSSSGRPLRRRSRRRTTPNLFSSSSPQVLEKEEGTGEEGGGGKTTPQHVSNGQHGRNRSLIDSGQRIRPDAAIGRWAATGLGVVRSGQQDSVSTITPETWKTRKTQRKRENTKTRDSC